MFSKGDVVIHEKIGIPYTVRYLIDKKGGGGKEWINLEGVSGIWEAKCFKLATEYRKLKILKLKKKIKYKKLYKFINYVKHW
jgi:hypothetical protein